MTIQNQPIGLAYTGWLFADEFSGVIGITYSSLTDGRTTILDHLKEQGQIDKQAFCTKLRKQMEGKSEIIFGGCDQEPEGGMQPILKINNKYTGWRLKMTKLIVRAKNNTVLYTAEPNHETVRSERMQSVAVNSGHQ